VTRLLLWRHGQTAWNAGRRVQGQTDTELSDVGRGQAEAAARRLAELHPDLIVSSDLRRAADTAAALAAITGLDVEYDSRLRERHHGIWEGLTDVEIAERWPEENECWRSGLPVRGLGVEDLDEVGKRVVSALQDVVSRAPGSTIVVASHGAAIRRSAPALLGWPEPVIRTLGAISNCHWADLRLDPERGWQLRAYNAG
jgi:glucosyl-3-phosphoglycerate phosphatase